MTKNKQVSSRNVVRDKKHIKFTSKLEKDDTFRVGFKVDYVKPISAAFISETITIYASENKPLLFVIHMDNNTIEMRILTDIIDERALV